jgi:septal ring factor EnvC (AmiA/AmiB activator)
MRKRIVVCLLLSAFWISEGFADVEQKTEELNAIQAGIKSIWQKMQSIQLQKKTIHTQLEEIEKRYGETAAVLNALREQIELKRQNLINIHLDMEQKQVEISRQNRELAGQIRAAYAMGQKEKLKLLLNQQDPALSSRMMVYYDYLTRARLKKLEGIKATLQRLDQLDQQKQQEAALLMEDLERTKSEQIVLEGVRKQRNELLAQLGKEFSSNEQELQRLQESENKLQSLIASLQQASEELVFEAEKAKQEVTVEADDISLKQGDSEAEPEVAEQKDNAVEPKTQVIPAKGDFPALKGKLPWPIQGRLVQKFGSPRLDSRWDGVLIDAREGTAIRAVTSGKVVYAEWLRGYGLLTIIDHGKGYMTLYAFNQSLYKKMGDWVESGDVIAAVGQSGGRSQPALYFGIRKKGTAVDPLEWCRK